MRVFRVLVQFPLDDLVLNIQNSPLQPVQDFFRFTKTYPHVSWSVSRKGGEAQGSYFLDDFEMFLFL